MFDEIVSTPARLREIVGMPSHRMADKAINHIDAICKKYIAASPYIVVSTKGSDGLMDVSPKGDPAGFVHLMDRRALIILDRLGNKRADTFENLLTNNELGIIFLIPGFSYILRVSGTGQIIRDAALQSRFAINGKEPNLLLGVTVAHAFIHCGKSIARSSIWEPENWPDTGAVPSYAASTVAHAKLSESLDEMQARIDDDFDTRMY